MSHKKFGPDRFSRFDVYWIQTDKQTNRQAKFIYRYTYITVKYIYNLFIVTWKKYKKKFGKFSRFFGGF